MAFTPLSEVALPEGSRCAVHADSAAANACRRCGTFCCAACSASVDGFVFCATCLESDEVNYLEATRRRFWGKRDVWVWLYAVFSIPGLFQIPRLLAANDSFGLFNVLVHGVIGVACLMLWPWSRLALVFATFTTLKQVFWPTPDMLLSVGGTKPWSDDIASLVQLGSAGVFALSLAVSIAAYRSPRNRLAFRLPVSDAGLRRVYAHYVANPYAARAAAYGIASLLIPIAAPFTLWLALTARKRARASTFPPSSGSRAALVGLVASVTSLVLWLTLLAFTFAT